MIDLRINQLFVNALYRINLFWLMCTVCKLLTISGSSSKPFSHTMCSQQDLWVTLIKWEVVSLKGCRWWLFQDLFVIHSTFIWIGAIIEVLTFIYGDVEVTAEK